MPEAAQTRSRTTTVFSTGLVVIGITILLKGLDFIKNILAVSRFGLTDQADVYNLIIALPDFLVVIVGLDTIRGAAMSFFTQFAANGEQEQSDALFSSLANWGIVFALVLAAAATFWMSDLVRLLAAGFSDEKLSFAIRLAYIIVPVLMFRVLSGIVVSVLNAHGVFVRVQLFAAIPAVLMVVVLLFADVNHLAMEIVWAFAIGVGFSIAGLIVLVRKYVRWTFRWKKLSPVFWNVVRISGTLVLSMSVAQIAAAVERRTASFFPTGTIAALTYAASLAGNIVFLIVLSLFSIIQRDLGLHIASGDKHGAYKRFWEIMGSLMFIIAFGAVLLAVFREPILTLLYQRKAFDAAAVERTAIPLSIYAFWMIGQSVAMITTPLLLSLHRSRTIVISSIIAFGVEIGVVHQFAESFGYAGIAGAAALGALLYGSSLIIGVRISEGAESLHGLSLLIRILIAAGCAAAGMLVIRAWLHERLLSQVWNIQLSDLIVAFAGLSIYLVLSSLIGVNRLKNMYAMIAATLSRSR